MIESSFGNFKVTNNRSITQTIDEAHSASLNNVQGMKEATARGYFLAPGMGLATAVVALTGIWILAWGDVLALLWDHYSDGQSLSYK